jgi:RNA polymerase sigma factor (sigma-70 family)
VRSNDPDHPAVPDSIERIPAEAQLHALIESLRPDLLRRLHALCERHGDPELGAADLAHASVARFLASVRRDGRTDFSRGEAWGLLTTIAQHLLIDALRRRNVKDSALEVLRRDLLSTTDESDAEPATHVELRDLAEHAMSAMTPEERLLVMQRMRGASWAAIAAETGISEDALRQRWSTLRRRLRPLAEDDR